nr:helix-turn-helix transcriptional regulator [Limosilactobacillus mucosae]
MSEIIRPDAGKVLGQLIREKGLKQSFVADEIGISGAYLSQITNGSRRLSAEVAIRASLILKVPIDIFLHKS